MTYRKHSNKHKSAKKFRTNMAHTKAVNMAPAPMRGGYRL
ncbi:MAG: hypothetical protein [Microvirus sp.]|nr:MAG: hypothetical protein [Microvirus sp.]